MVPNLRKIFGETNDGMPYILTLPKRGYRISVPVKEGLCEDAQLTINNKNPFSLSKSIKTWQFQLVLATIFIIVAYYFLSYNINNRPKEDTKVNLAILPFINIKSDPEIEFLGYSLADTIITKLSNIENIEIIPSHSVRKYQSKFFNDIPKIAQELKVDKLVTGSYLKDGNNLRINVQLFDTKTNRTIPLEKLDFQYSNIIKVQDLFSQNLIQELNIRLSPIESQKIKHDFSSNPLAYEYYLRGINYFFKNQNEQAINILKRSIESDPQYSPSWLVLGRAYNSYATNSLGGKAYLELSQTAFQKSIELNPQQIFAHIFLANLLTKTNRVEEAVPKLRSVLSKNIDNSELHLSLAFAYFYAGMFEDAMTEIERAYKLNPEVYKGTQAYKVYIFSEQYEKYFDSLLAQEELAYVQFQRGYAHFYMKNWDQATIDFKNSIKLDPNSIYGKLSQGFLYIIQKKKNEAWQTFNQLNTVMHKNNFLVPDWNYLLAQGYALTGKNRDALNVLRECIENGFFCYPYLRKDPLIQNLGNEPEYAVLMETAKQRHEAFKKRFFSVNEK